jgi:hypothetical protein
MEASVNKKGGSHMNCSPVLKRGFITILFISLFISTAALADNLLITRHFSGVWDQPEQESQGIILQIGEQDGDEKVGIAYWFTYGEDLQTTWFLAVGPVNGNQINMNLYTAFNIEFMADNVEGNANVELVGTMDLVFKNCNHGTASFDTPEEVVGSGEFPIKRINSIYRTRCSGGISDDTPPHGKPLQFEVRLHPPLEGDPGNGKAKLWERADRSDFKVVAEDLPMGDYPLTLKVCEQIRGEMQVADGMGELVFRSPSTESTLILDFDPKEDCLIELLDGDDVVLTSGDAVLEEKQPDKPGNDNGNEMVRLDADFVSTDVIEGANGSADYDIKMNSRDFSIMIKDVPAGIYAVVVNTAEVGEFEVVEEDGDFVGKIKFSDPQKGNAQELDFDPRGELIEILQADDQVILDVLFPE